MGLRIVPSIEKIVWETDPHSRFYYNAERGNIQV